MICLILVMSLFLFSQIVNEWVHDLKSANIRSVLLVYLVCVLCVCSLFAERCLLTCLAFVPGQSFLGLKLSFSLYFVNFYRKKNSYSIEIIDKFLFLYKIPNEHSDVNIL